MYIKVFLAPPFALIKLLNVVSALRLFSIEGVKLKQVPGKMHPVVFLGKLQVWISICDLPGTL